MSATEEKKDEWPQETLPSNVRPVHYFLSYTNVDLEKAFTFDGKVTIDLDVKEDNVDKIIINSDDMTYSSIRVIQNDVSSDVAVSKIAEDKVSQQVTIPLATTLQTGSAQLEIAFKGQLNDNLKGFYRSKYKVADGSDAVCGITQFEACDARLALPCWDEPAAKATFTLQMEYPKHLICLSNMPVVKETETGKCKVVTFDKTPKMSTYLLAWVIGDFEYIEDKTQRGVVMRIYTSVGNQSKATYALKVAVKCLDFYEKYFSIEYPLPKCDMIALADFAAGAMENWGLITYREVRLICDEATAALEHKRDIARVICHELAHQWFGNYTTMKWWDNLWLNEGFASFMQYLSGDAVEPELNLWSMFMTREYANAFKLDGMSSSHPIEVPVPTAKGADEVFDVISYCKGCCVIVMLQSFLGDDAFQKGLTAYLTRFAYDNTVTTDLWHHLSQSSGKDVGAIMQCWTRAQGFPVIQAQISSKEKGTLLLKQSRYLSSGKPSPAEDETVWNVPIVMKVNGELVRLLLDEREKEFTIAQLKTAQYVHLNADSKGFYCTQYDDNMLQLLLPNLSSLTDLDRMSLIRDSLYLSKAGCTERATQQFLDLLRASQQETSQIVWDELLSAAGDIHHLLDSDEATQTQFDDIMCSLLTPVYEALNRWGDDDDAKQKGDQTRNDVFRPLILGAMARHRYQPVIDEILKRFDACIVQKQAQATIPDALRSVIYSNAMRYGDEARYKALKAHFASTTDNMDKRTALSSLGRIGDADLVLQTLAWIKDSDEVRKQDKIFGLGACARSKTGRDVTWTFLQQSLEEWKTMFGGGGFLLNAIVKLPSHFIEDSKADEVEKFYAGVQGYEACQKSISQCVENIRLNAKWRKHEIENIKKWVESNDSKK